MVAAALSLLIAGCASNPPPPPPYQPPTAQVVLPPPVLTSDQIAKLCQAAPDTCHRVQNAQPLTLADVKAMAKIGFNSDVIIAVVRNSHAVFHLTADAIIDLKKSGVGEPVINFLINTPSTIAETTPKPEAQVPPPAPMDETPPPTPGPDYVWVGGDWVWNGGWVWAGGHWVIPPYPHAYWYHGVWRRGWGGYRPDRRHYWR